MNSTDSPKELQALEYYTQQAARRTFYSRLALLTLIFSMLAANMWLTQRNYEAMIINLNQTRLAQDQLHDRTAVRLDEMEQQILHLQHTVSTLENPPLEVAAAH